MAFLVANHQTKAMDYMNAKNQLITGVCDLIYVKSIIRYIDLPDLDVEVILEVQNMQTTWEFTLKFASAIKSQESMLEALANHEFFISFKYVNALRDYLLESAKRAKINNQYEYYHETLGYVKPDQGNPKFFLGDTRLSQGGISRYTDREFKFKSGSLGDYESFMKREVFPYENMRFALVLGLSSVAASYLMEYADVGTMIINLSGASSTGKTTIAQLIASLWGEPKISGLGLVRTFNSTFNALMHSLRGVSGVPVSLDDATSNGFKNRTELIYQLAQSEPKLRMSPNIEIRDQGLSWSGAIFITSETPVITESENRMGILSRVIDTDGLVFTESAEHAEAIKRFIGSNYGHVGRQFVKAFNLIPDEDIKALYEEAKEKVLEMLVVKDGLSGRIASKLAIIYMTAKVIHDHLKYEKVIPDEVMDYLVGKDQEEVNHRHIAEKALEVIKGFIIENHRHFEKFDKHSVIHSCAQGALYGHFRYIGAEVIVTIPTARVEEVFRSHHIYDTRVIYRHWYEQGTIKKQAERYSIKDSRLNVRCIKFSFTRDEDTLIPWFASAVDTASDKDVTVPIANVPELSSDADIDAIFDEEQADDN